MANGRAIRANTRATAKRTEGNHGESKGGNKADKTERKCKYFGELSIPVPFSITAFVLTVGIGVSVWVKGADREGRE